MVKVERPPRGDDTREWGPPFLPDDGPSAYYVSCNRGKRSLALDLARPESRAVLDDLIRTADAIIENFLPQTLEKLGLTEERLATLNPRLVRASISGYGRIGPEAATPGYDLVVQATAGIMSITGEPDGTPMKIGVAITDVLTGLYAAVSVLSGLLQVRGEGPGRASCAASGSARGEGTAKANAPAFDLALADCTLAAMVNVVQGRWSPASGRGDMAMPIRRSFPTRHLRRPTGTWCWPWETIHSGSDSARRSAERIGPPIRGSQRTPPASSIATN